ncbi:hypothetical protein HZC07_04935 [Candidatus Micrarchaeota archaeon]|nr:hypothetical protein [Candidatus Micrarchaeota archaeon]
MPGYRRLYTINLGPPPQSKKLPFSKPDSDEAQVTKRAIGRSEWIERRQKTHGTGQKFKIGGREIYSGTVEGHILRAGAVIFASSLYPENIVDIRRLYLFRKNGKDHAASYSFPIESDPQIAERRGKYLRAYNRETNEEIRKRMRRTFDRLERDRNPELLGLTGQLRTAGIIPSHPEANYEMDQRTRATVFFEMDSVDFYKALIASHREEWQESDNVNPVRHLAAYYALALKCMAHKERTGKETEFREIGFDELFKIAHGIFYPKTERTFEIVRQLMIKGIDAYKDGVEHLRKLVSVQRDDPSPITIDPKVWKLVEMQ